MIRMKPIFYFSSAPGKDSVFFLIKNAEVDSLFIDIYTRYPLLTPFSFTHPVVPRGTIGIYPLVLHVFCLAAPGQISPPVVSSYVVYMVHLWGKLFPHIDEGEPVRLV